MLIHPPYSLLVSVDCKDTRIAVQVRTNKPFNGRIYALGRSETCNNDVLNSDQFRLDLTMGGQDCNTQSVIGVYSNTVVLQHHSVVMTKADKIYKVKCTYNMSSKNITFGMMPIRYINGKHVWNFGHYTNYMYLQRPRNDSHQLIAGGSTTENPNS